MSTPTFTWFPDTGWSVKSEPKNRTAAFGDGYAQIVADGINNDLEEWTLRFTGTSARGIAIRNFLRERGGAKPFRWTTPEGDTRFFICKSWNRSREKGVLMTLSATFVQVPYAS